MMQPNSNPDSTAIVLSGGGARGAYEAGVIHYIRTMLPKPLCYQRFPIQCGSSVGAINTCFLASTADDLDYQAKQMIELWRNLKPENIYIRNNSAFYKLAFYSLLGIFRNLTRFGYFKQKHGKTRHFVSLFDTTPFADYLSKTIQWSKIHENIKKGLLKTVSLVATRMRTGKAEIFYQKGSDAFYQGDYPTHSVDLGPVHAMASSAIPFIFSNILIGDYYYVDGSMRLNTPLSPAIQFGAKRILVIDLHPPNGEDPFDHGCPESQCPPSLGEHVGKLLNSYFLDRVQYDVDQLRRINRLIDASEKVYGKNYLNEVNQVLEKGHRLNTIDYLQISPSTSLGTIFSDWFNSERKSSVKFSFIEKFLMRLLDVHPAINQDLGSYLTFENGYIEKVIELGFEDARKRHDEIGAFLEGSIS